MNDVDKHEIELQKFELSRWLNEDTLINQRLTWLLGSQALLFAAYGSIATKILDACATPEKAKYLVSLLPVITHVGQLLAAVVFVGIAAAIMAQYTLHKRRAPSPGQIGVSTFTTLLGWGTSLAVPVIFFSVWCLVPVQTIADTACIPHAATGARPG